MSSLADYRHPPAIRRLLQSLTTVICPAQAIELGLQDAIVDHVELSMRASQRGLRAALITGLSGYDLASMAMPAHRGKRASALSNEKAAAYFASWYHSKLKLKHEFAKGIKSLIALACYEQPEMMSSIGYTPADWIERSKKVRLETYQPAIEKRAIAVLAADPLPGVTHKEERDDAN